MKFAILLPMAPINLKTLRLANTAELHNLAEPFGEYDSEEQAAFVVRNMQRGAVAMPFQVELGSGSIVVMLGLIAADAQRRQFNPDQPIPFAILVQPLPQTDIERRRMKQQPGDVFDQKLWQVRPERPDMYTPRGVELRSTQLAAPLFTTVQVGRDAAGRLTVHLSAGSDAFSLHFDDKALDLRLESSEDEDEDEDYVIEKTAPSL